MIPTYCVPKNGHLKNPMYLQGTQLIDKCDCRLLVILTIIQTTTSSTLIITLQMTITKFKMRTMITYQKVLIISGSLTPKRRIFLDYASSTLINVGVIQATIKPKMGEAQHFTTTQKSFWSRVFFVANRIFFPKFCKTYHVLEVLVDIFHSPSSCYNIIISRDILSFGFNLDSAQEYLPGRSVHSHGRTDAINVTKETFDPLYMRPEYNTLQHARKYNYGTSI